MSTILVNITISGGRIKRSSLEVLSRCRNLASQNSRALEAVIIDDEPEKYVEDVSSYGPAKIYTVKDPVFKKHLNTPILAALNKVIESSSPDVVAFDSTEGTKDILGALAAHHDAAVLPDVSGFDLSNNGIKAKRPVMASKVIANTEASGKPVLVSVRSGSYDAVESSSEHEPEIEPVELDMNEGDLRQTLREVIGSSGDKVDLSEAEVIVSAGRGVRDDEGKKLISELAGIFNAAIGASRALTEAGMYDPSLQIGQTGKVVSPQLYFAIGISGAIQHVAGMANSKTIIAINKDPDAPIFDIADYGLVGDLYKILPPLIEELKKAKN